MDLLIIMPSNPWVIETEHGMRGGGWVGRLRRKAFKLQALAWHPSIISFMLLLNADISQISTACICSVQNTQLLVLLTLCWIHLPLKILTKLRAVANYEFREEKTRSTMKADTNEAWPIQSKNEKSPRVMCKTHRLGGAGRNRFRKKMADSLSQKSKPDHVQVRWHFTMSLTCPTIRESRTMQADEPYKRQMYEVRESDRKLPVAQAKTKEHLDCGLSRNREIDRFENCLGGKCIGFQEIWRTWLAREDGLWFSAVEGTRSICPTLMCS